MNTFHTYNFQAWQGSKPTKVTVRARSLIEAVNKMSKQLKAKKITAYKVLGSD